MAKVTVTISGPQGSGKTRVHEALRSALYGDQTTVPIGQTDFGLRSLWQTGNVEFEIVEQQQQSPDFITDGTISALTFKIDTSRIPAAIADMDRLAGAARNASKAIERLNALTAGRRQ